MKIRPEKLARRRGKDTIPSAHRRERKNEDMRTVVIMKACKEKRVFGYVHTEEAKTEKI